MNRHISAILALTLSLGMLLAAAPTAGAEVPALAGTVVKTGGAALAQARVELLAPGTEQVVHEVYTDPRGRFAFRTVAAGSYDLRIRFGDRVLSQKNGDGSVQSQRVTLGGEPQQLTIQLA